MPLYKAWDINRRKRKAVAATGYECKGITHYEVKFGSRTAPDMFRLDGVS